MTIRNGKRLSISSFGSKDLVANSHSFKLRKVFHVPFISTNLISVAKFCSDNNALIEFYPHSFFVRDQLTKKVLAQGKPENGLYRFPSFSSKKTYVVVNKCQEQMSYSSSFV